MALTLTIAQISAMTSMPLRRLQLLATEGAILPDNTDRKVKSAKKFTLQESVIACILAEIDDGLKMSVSALYQIGEWLRSIYKVPVEYGWTRLDEGERCWKHHLFWNFVENDDSSSELLSLAKRLGFSEIPEERSDALSKEEMDKIWCWVMLEKARTGQNDVWFNPKLAIGINSDGHWVGRFASGIDEDDSIRKYLVLKLDHILFDFC